MILYNTRYYIRKKNNAKDKERERKRKVSVTEAYIREGGREMEDIDDGK